MMNIIYLHSHDMGRVNSAYGYSMPTPKLKAFAEKSTIFRQAYCAAPTCSPSRAAMLTGLTAHESGVTGLIHRGFRLANPNRHLARHLSFHGYDTALFGIQHEVPTKHEGEIYDHYHVPQGGDPFALDLNCADAAATYLSKPPTKPFFLSFGVFAPHRPFLKADPQEFNPAAVPLLHTLPDSAAIRRDVADYQVTVRAADEALGRVLEAIFSAGLHHKSLIFLTTDHGIAFPGAKCLLHDAGIGVTLMMRAPDMETPAMSDALVSHLDIFPTCCDYAGLPVPGWLQGTSLRPLLTGKQTGVRDRIFAEVNYHASYEPMRCVRTSSYKLIRFFDEDLRVRLANIDDGWSKTDLLNKGLLPLLHPRIELYDLAEDPLEECNLAGRADLAEIQRDLEIQLHRWMQETHDPLLSGRTPNPPGARINRVECLSGTEKYFESNG